MVKSKPKNNKPKKLKLKPSARDKRRYLLINEKNNQKIEETLFHYLGVLGMAKSAYMKVKTKGNKIIGSVLRENLNDVRVALALSEIRVEKVSGTLKGLEK